MLKFLTRIQFTVSRLITKWVYYRHNSKVQLTWPYPEIRWQLVSRYDHSLASILSLSYMLSAIFLLTVIKKTKTKTKKKPNSKKSL